MTAILCPTCRRRHEVPGDFLFDWAARVVSTKQGEARLTPTEADILHIVITKAPAVVTRREIERDLDGAGDGPETPDCLRVHISHLRSKIAPIGLHIETVWGRGYRFAGYSPAPPFEAPRFKRAA